MSNNSIAVSLIQTHLETYEPKVFKNRKSHYYANAERFFYSFTQAEIDSLFVGSKFLITLRLAIESAKEGGTLASTKDIGFKGDIVYLSMQTAYAFFLNDGYDIDESRELSHKRRYNQLIYAFKEMLRENVTSSDAYSDLLTQLNVAKDECNQAIYDTGAKLNSQKEHFLKEIAAKNKEIDALKKEVAKAQNSRLGNLAAQINAKTMPTEVVVITTEDVDFELVEEVAKPKIYLPRVSIQVGGGANPLRVSFHQFTGLLYEQLNKLDAQLYKKMLVGALKYGTSKFGLKQDLNNQMGNYSFYKRALYYFENRTPKEQNGVYSHVHEDSAMGTGMSYLDESALKDICNHIGIEPVFLSTEMISPRVSNPFWVYLHGMGAIKQSGRGFVFTDEIKQIIPGAYNLNLLRVECKEVPTGDNKPVPKRVVVSDDAPAFLHSAFANLQSFTNSDIQ